MTTEVNEESSPQDLLQAVRQLVGEVRNLNTRLTKQYPNRDEVRRQGRRRALQSLAFGVVLIVAAQVVTLSTVSYCFLNPSPGSEPRAVCRVIPGYGHAIAESNSRLARFELLLSQIDVNREQVRQLKIENERQQMELNELQRH